MQSETVYLLDQKCHQGESSMNSAMLVFFAFLISRRNSNLLNVFLNNNLQMHKETIIVKALDILVQRETLKYLNKRRVIERIGV
jgi:hypothetical protein